MVAGRCGRGCSGTESETLPGLRGALARGDDDRSTGRLTLGGGVPSIEHSSALQA